MRMWINLCEALVTEMKPAARRNHAAAASLHRLLTVAGAEFGGETFQLEDVEKMGLQADFKRAQEADFIHKVANPSWWDPTERGQTALRLYKDATAPDEPSDADLPVVDDGVRAGKPSYVRMRPTGVVRRR